MDTVKQCGGGRRNNALTLALIPALSAARGLQPAPLSAIPEPALPPGGAAHPAWETAACLGPFLRIDGQDLPDAHGYGFSAVGNCHD